MISISFVRSHLSISEFPETRLSDFSIITGPNGSGKTHFLRAIGVGALEIGGLRDRTKAIRYLDWNSMVPKPQEEFRGDAIVSEERKLLTTAIDLKNKYRDRLQGSLQKSGLLQTSDWTLEELTAPSDERAQELLNQGVMLENAKERLEGFFGQYVEIERDAVFKGFARFLTYLEKISNDLQKPIYLLRDQDIVENVPVLWGEHDLFEQSFARVFVVYRDALVRNKLLMMDSADGQEDANPLSQGQFEAQYGVAPWDLVNKFLLASGLDFEVSQPDTRSFDSYRPTLIKRNSNQVVEFQNLSSGEKVLLSLATCLYHAGDDRVSAQFPKVLLLDEVDAPLHPSMSRVLLKSVRESLVEKFGIKVILTTHSPSTVALADEECIYVMRPDKSGVFKATKDEAVNLLTEGVPTLNVSYDSRRQVFVESPVDASIYDAVYRAVRSDLNSSQCLCFLSTGIRRDSGDVGTGCEAVKSITRQLRNMGNNSIFGVIDWDGKHQSDSFIKVLAENSRDGLENCLLDPLLLIFALQRYRSDRLMKFGFEEPPTIQQLLHMNSDDWQPIIDIIQSHILGVDKSVFRNRSVKYAGGLEINLSEQYLTQDDHKLHSMIMNGIPEFHELGRRPNALQHRIAEGVLLDYPELVPMEFINLFNALLE